jgi:hypothetical protein
VAIIGTVIAVRRRPRKHEAGFALVFSSLTILWMIARLVAPKECPNGHTEGGEVWIT